jgi:hypothetical protein
MNHHDVLEALNPVPLAPNDRPLSDEESVLLEKLARQIPLLIER